MQYLILLIVFGIITIYVYKKLKRSEGEAGSLDNAYKILEIKVPKNDETHIEMQTAPLAAENMFASIHGLLQENESLQESISFEIASGSNGLRFFVAVPPDIASFVENQIYAQYPMAHIIQSDDYMFDATTSGYYGVADVKLSKDDIFPINTFRDFEVDPLSAITSSLADTLPGDDVWFQVIVKPMPDVWQKAGHDYVAAVRGEKEIAPSLLKELPKAVLAEFANFGSNLLDRSLGKFDEYSSPPFKPSLVRLSAGQELELKALENKLTKMGFKVVIRVFAKSETEERVRRLLRSVLASMTQFSIANLNSFTSSVSIGNKSSFDKVRGREFEDNAFFVLDTEELASVYHLPSSAVATPNISWLHAKQSEPPANLPIKDCAFIGDTLFRNEKIRFGISNDDDRLRHMYLIGKSGTGKSTLFLNMIIQDIKNGQGVGVLDPHGELIEKILDYIPDDRVKDVILIDPSDTERPVGINLLELSDPSQKNLMASALVSAIKVHFDYSWGPRLEYLLNYSILTLLELEGTTMLSITRLLNDMNYQKYVLHQVKDPVVVRFWEEEYKEMRGNQKLITEAVAPIQNKVNRFLSSTTIRNILAQRNSTIDFYDAMNSGKILLMNLSKGRMGEDNANLLGSFLVSRIQFMAMQRQNIPSAERRPFYLYVDEFQNFTTGSFESILSESRKYGLGLYLTHQYTSQLPEELLEAVFGNVGTIATFSLGAPDALVLENELTPYFLQGDVISLERFQIYIKLMIDGMTSKPFSAKILLPWEKDSSVVEKTGNKEKAILYSREKYGTSRESIEDKVAKWVERRFDKGMAIAQEYRMKEGKGV